MNFSPEFYVYVLGSFQGLPGMGKPLTFVERFDYAAIETDADFEAKRLVMFATTDLGPQTESTRFIPQINFNIRDNSTGRTMFNGYVSTAELFGDGRVPFVLPTSHFFQRGGAAQVLYDPVDPGPDVDAATIWLAMVGSKHFERVSP